MALTGYKFGTKYYVDLYQVPSNTLWKWVRKGYALDDPKSLLAQVAAQTAPNSADLTVLRALCGVGSVPGPIVRPGRKPPPKKTIAAPAPNPCNTVQAPPPAAQDGPGQTEAPKEDNPPQTAIEGFQLELARLKVECDLAYRGYKASDDPVMRNAYWKTWRDMLDSWGKLAKLAPDAEREAGLLMRKVDVEAMWDRTHKEVKNILEAIPRRLSTSLVPHVPRMLSAVDIEQAAKLEIMGVMTTLQGGV